MPTVGNLFQKSPFAQHFQRFNECDQRKRVKKYAVSNEVALVRTKLKTVKNFFREIFELSLIGFL